MTRVEIADFKSTGIAREFDKIDSLDMEIFPTGGFDKGVESLTYSPVSSSYLCEVINGVKNGRPQQINIFWFEGDAVPGAYSRLLEVQLQLLDFQLKLEEGQPNPLL